MVSPKTEALTAQFYQWEMLGRGWLSAPEPVDLEPPFTPFFGHFIRKQPIVDDGLRHTLISSFVSAFKKKALPKVIEQSADISYDLFPFADTSPLISFELRITNQTKIPVDKMEQLLVMLSYCTRPLSFEIIGNHTQIKLQFVCREEDAPYVKSQLVTFLKGVAIIEVVTFLQPFVLEYIPFTTVDFGLQEEFMRPLGQLKGSVIDPLTGLFSILEYVGEGEQVIFQVLFNGVLNNWQSSILKSVSDKKGGAFFEDAPEMLPLAKEKVSAPLFCATIRLLVQADSLDQSFSLLHKLTFAIITNSRSHFNALLPLSDAHYSAAKRATDINFRESHRAGMLLNCKELATFIHIPDTSLVSKKLMGNERKTKRAPAIMEGHAFKLGLNLHNGITEDVTISNDQRMKHTHIIGATGTGKSTLLLTMICQDIINGEGVAVLDPHGDLIDAILTVIPKSRVQDVLVIDPSDSEYPVSFNILKAHSDIEKEVLSSDLVAAFKKLSTSWGDQMNSVFANAILAFLESTKGGSLIDIRRFLIEKSYREEYLKSVSDLNISYYWQKEYPLLRTNSIGSILTRLDAFLRPRSIRNMVAQQEGIDFETVLRQKKILLVKLSQGLIGTENSYLLGSFFVSKIHQAALARQATLDRSDFFVYIDEFQHFITPSMAHILSGARKYRVGLILAHQDLQQLQKSDGELLNTLITNAGTRICFRLGDTDAKRMAEGFSFFEPHDLQNLNTGEAIVRIERPEFDFSLSIDPFDSSQETYVQKETVINHSRNTYGTPKRVVEDMLRKSMTGTTGLETREDDMPKTSAKKEQPIISTPIRTQAPSFQLSEDEIETVVKKKEETQHRYLQTLIKKVAESKGYRAVIEMPTPDGKGKVDVSLERDTDRIAVEVSVTTDADWEVHNIQKCLAAGYKRVFVCTTDAKFKKVMLDAIQRAFDITTQTHIQVGNPEELFQSFESMSQKEFSGETKIKGYRVKVQYEDLSESDMNKKRESIAKVISDSMKKMKKQ